MKLTITRTNLLNALNIVKAAAKGSTLPILGNVAVNTFDKSVEFICTNLDLTLRAKVEAEVHHKGQFTVPCAALQSLVNSFSGDDTELDLELDGDILIVHCGSSKYQFGTLPFADFPPQQQSFKDAEEVTLPQARLRQMLALTSFCASEDEARYVLQGNLLKLNGDITTVATDGRRLAMCSETADEPLTPRECIVPAFAIAALLRLLSTNEEATDRVRVRFTPAAAQFKLGDIEVTTKLIEGNYPNYQQVIPSTRGLKPVTIARAEFLQLLERVSIIQSESVRLDFNRHSLTLRTVNRKDLIGDAYENMDTSPCETPLKIRFNPKYLVQALKAISDDEIQFYATDAVSPGVFKTGAKSLHPGWHYVVMPMRGDEDAPAATDTAKAAPAETKETDPEANASGAAPKGKKAKAEPVAA